MASFARSTLLSLLLMWHQIASASIVVLLGDSMTVGHGIYAQSGQYPPDPIGNPAVDGNGQTYEFGETPGEFCWRDTERASGALVAAAQTNVDFVNLGCSGAAYTGILSQWEYAKASLELDEETTILLSFGANDGFRIAGLNGGGIVSLDSLQTCFANSLPFAPVATDGLTDWEEIERRVDEVFNLIAAEAPVGAAIRVIGYPLQFRPYLGFLCFSIVAPCARVFDATISRINTILRTTTERLTTATLDMAFVDIEDNNLLPLAACSVTDRHIRDLTLNLDKFFGGQLSIEGLLSTSSFHPTADAHAEIAGRILESLTTS